MSSDRFHKAAKDGLLDILKEITRAEANNKDEDGMTPVLWAAFEGRLDALRLLVGRGGDPDKFDTYGNTTLHLAAAKGHLHCVDFLVKFGVNLYALDIDKHSAKDLAAINNRDNILRYLDSATSNLEIRDRKKAKALKELAEKNCAKCIKEYLKRQQRLDSESENIKSIPHRPSVLSTLKQKIWSCSQGNLKQTFKDQTINSNVTKFSELLNGGGGSISSRAGAVQKKVYASKLRHLQNQQKNDDSGFKIGEIEPDGKRTVTSLTGLRRDSEVLYVGSFSSNSDNGKRGKIADIFDLETDDDTDHGDRICKEIGYGTLSRSYSQPDFLAIKTDNDVSTEVRLQRPAGLFDRPTLGSLTFQRSITAALNQLHPEVSSINSSNSMTTTRKTLLSSKPRGIKSRSFLTLSDTDTEDASESDDEQQNSRTSIQRFLTAWGLEEHFHIFQKQQIDLDTLMLLTEDDLKSLGLPLGPFRKLTIAIQERKNALTNPGAITDTRL